MDLWRAVCRGDVARVRDALIADPARVNDKHDGQCLLSAAAERGHDETVRFMLGVAGVDPLARDDEGRTALMTAAIYDMPSTMDVLASTLAYSCFDTDKYGDTAMGLAEFHDSFGVLDSHAGPDRAAWLVYSCVEFVRGAGRDVALLCAGYVS
jgi:ankyrin repeat protein